MVQVMERYAGIMVDIETVRPFMRRGFPWHTPDSPNPPNRPADDWWLALRPVFEEAFVACRIPPEQAAELAPRVRTVYLDLAEWRLFDDTLEVLDQLSGEGWVHAILSNHVPELPDIIRGLGLAPLIHRVVNSAETGFEKPHAGAYRSALAVLDDPGQIWMIGDNITADVLGAESAGIPAILARTDDPRAQRRTANLRDVLWFLRPATTQTSSPSGQD
jgi:putative hydrolase of the HAD superfamily